MDTSELGAFLRSRRERIRPSDVGLPAGRRRRTPGLRREEVAQLSFISVEYYARLEQARGPRPSAEVLGALARALRLSDVQRDHLHQLAGTPAAPPSGPRRQVRQSILDLLHRLPQAAAIVVSAAYEVLAWNDLAAALMEDFSATSPNERNLLRRAFLGPDTHGRRLFGVSDVEQFGRVAAHDLRATAARHPDDPYVRRLVADLLAGSEEFGRLWATHDVGAVHALHKTFLHPLVGPVTVDCDTLDIPGSDQHVVVYTAAPGSPAEEALRLLAVLGTQHVAVPH